MVGKAETKSASEPRHQLQNAWTQNATAQCAGEGTLFQLTEGQVRLDD